MRDALKDNLQSDVGKCDAVCEGCGAFHWSSERTKAIQRTGKHIYSTCCQGGKVMLPEHYFPQNSVPPIIKWLLTSLDPGTIQWISTEFRYLVNFSSHQDAVVARRRIRDYNNALTFTSMVAKGQDHDVAGPKGIFTFCLNGRLHHYVGSTWPKPEEKPCFSQIYTVGDGGTQEAKMRQDHQKVKLDDVLLLKLQTTINDTNVYAKLFKNAKEILSHDPGSKLVIKCVKPGKKDDLKRYNLPTVDEIGMVIPGDGTINKKERNIFLERRYGKLIPINDMHTGYLPMRYVLCFPGGAQQWSEHYKSPTGKRNNVGSGTDGEGTSFIFIELQVRC